MKKIFLILFTLMAVVIFADNMSPVGKWKTIDVALIRGVLTEKKDIEELPSFDILISGNKKVIDWGKSIGLETQYFSRSEGIGYSGTELRGLYQGGR